MVDVDAESEVERINKAKEEVKKAKIAVDMRYLYERLKKSVNLDTTASETEFPNSNLQTLLCLLKHVFNYCFFSTTVLKQLRGSYFYH